MVKYREFSLLRDGLVYRSKNILKCILAIPLGYLIIFVGPLILFWRVYKNATNKNVVLFRLEYESSSHAGKIRRNKVYTPVYVRANKKDRCISQFKISYYFFIAFSASILHLSIFLQDESNRFFFILLIVITFSVISILETSNKEIEKNKEPMQNILARKYGLPRKGEFYDWGALPLEVFKSWFKWEDNKAQQRFYLRYLPPSDDLVCIYYYKNSSPSFLVNKGDEIYFGELYLPLGKRFMEHIFAPVNGIYVSMPEANKLNYKTYRANIYAKEFIFYIDYSTPKVQYSSINSNKMDSVPAEIIIKLQKLKELASRGVGGEKENAKRMLYDLLKKHKLSDNDLNT